MIHTRAFSRKGFTLIELVIVIAILGVLVAIAVTSFVNMSSKSRTTSDTYVAKKIQRAIITYRIESNDMSLSKIPHGTSAALISGLQTTTTIPANSDGQKVGNFGPYLESGVTIAPQDPNAIGWIIAIDNGSNTVTVASGNGNTCSITP